MRLLTARQRSTDRWFPKVASGTMDAEIFATTLSVGFGVALEDILVVEQDVAADAVARVVEGLASGRYADVDVIGTCTRWPADDPDSALVYDAASVDRVTAKRILRVTGSVEDELKRCRLARQHDWAVSHDAWPDGFRVTPEERLAAHLFFVEDRERHLRVERLRAEGRALKHARGWGTDDAA